ncbi:MAG: pepsin/retropepsin-like aspartic protease family protein [Saprospiraceae bacterium]
MKKIFIITIVLFVYGHSFFAQEKLTFIKATSTKIKILDGDDLREGDLAPELKPDIYAYHKSFRQKKIVFYTDVDSISFVVNPGDIYNFAVLLNNKDTCYQRLTFENPNKVFYSRLSQKNSLTNDTIQFVLGANNAIHIKGKLNNSDILDLIFDTGASLGVLSEEGSRKKARLDKANKNKFEFSGITIENSPAIFVDYNGGLKADGVIGYNAFEDKIVEINYDKSIIVIHNSNDNISKSYSVIDMIWRGSGLFIEGILNIKNKKHNGLFLFDTGSKFALSLTKDFATTNQLYDVMPKVGTRRGRGVNGKTIKSNTVNLPQLIIADLSLENVPIDLELQSDNEGLDKNILGNDVLKRFNVILDYKNGLIYLQTNSLASNAYSKSSDEYFILIALGILLGLSIIGFIIYRKRNANR